jgi:hypothetical protein
MVFLRNLQAWCQGGWHRKEEKKMTTKEIIQAEIEKQTQGGKSYTSFQAVAILYVALALAEVADQLSKTRRGEVLG